MLDNFFSFLPASQRGFLYIFLGLVLILGALSKLGFFQSFLNIILIVVGLLLTYQGLRKTNLLKLFKKS
ncbi:hypothetical protein HYV10_00830 [Candidatus Dependentiae bacterium]|nr:hypothetical protein [Candidatus Dependentiae bacterium]